MPDFNQEYYIASKFTLSSLDALSIKQTWMIDILSELIVGGTEFTMIIIQSIVASI